MPTKKDLLRIMQNQWAGKRIRISRAWKNLSQINDTDDRMLVDS